MFRIICLALFAISSATMAYAKSDDALEKNRSFMMEAIKGDNSEIALGRLAMKKGDSAKVRDFGRTLIRDHKQAKAEALPIAKKLGLQPTKEMTSEAEEEKSKLQKLSGTEFDKEFADYMVKDHKKDIDDFQKEADEGKGDTAKLALKTIPALKKHLKMAEDLQ